MKLQCYYVRLLMHLYFSLKYISFFSLAHLQHLCLTIEGQEYHIQPSQCDLVLLQSQITQAQHMFCLFFFFFSSVSLIPQCQDYLIQNRSPSQEVRTTVFKVCSHSFICQSGSSQDTEHFISITGQIKDILVSSRQKH